MKKRTKKKEEIFRILKKTTPKKEREAFFENLTKQAIKEQRELLEKAAKMAS